MSLPKSKNYPLDFDQYETYRIDQRYKAQVYEFENMGLEKLDDIEFEFYTRGYKIFHTETAYLNEGKFKVVMIVAKSEMTF